MKPEPNQAGADRPVRTPAPQNVVPTQGCSFDSSLNIGRFANRLNPALLSVNDREFIRRRSHPKYFAKDGFEHDIAMLCEDEIRSAWGNLRSAAREFTFRVYIMSVKSSAMVTAMYPAWKEGTAYFNIRRLAFERMILEFLFERKLAGCEDTRKLPRDVLAWFVESPHGPEFWMRRYDEWIYYLEKSFDTFKNKSSYATRGEKQKREAASFGVIMKNASPALRELVAKTCVAPDFRNIFDAQQRERPRRWQHQFVDTWLIEIWPIVRRFEWRFPDISQALSEKPGNKADKYDHVNQLRERCKKELGLKLSCRVRRGRPSVRSESEGYYEDQPARIPPLFEVPAGIVSVGEDPEFWFNGYRGSWVKPTGYEE